MTARPCSSQQLDRIADTSSWTSLEQQPDQQRRADIKLFWVVLCGGKRGFGGVGYLGNRPNNKMTI